MQNRVLLPSKPIVISEEDNVGVYEIDGLYPGYGYTLGNSLRRVLLSSVPGFAVTKVKIKGISQEFSSIEGIMEDAIGIILNMKKLRFGSEIEQESFSLSLSKKGKGVVTGNDIKLPANIKLGNPEQYIAEITQSDVSLDIEFEVRKGIGFAKVEDRVDSSQEIGVILLDALFSPIKHVKYEVENMRVGDRTDFNKLRIVISTDGTITPREALEKTINVMIDQLRAVVGVAAVEDEKFVTGDPNDIPVSDLSLTPSIISALEEKKISRVGKILEKSEDELKEIQGIGDKAIESIKEALAEHGVKL